jgi:hypothetical protein
VAVSPETLAQYAADTQAIVRAVTDAGTFAYHVGSVVLEDENGEYAGTIERDPAGKWVITDPTP